MTHVYDNKEIIIISEQQLHIFFARARLAMSSCFYAKLTGRCVAVALLNCTNNKLVLIFSSHSHKESKEAYSQNVKLFLENKEL